MKKREVKLVRRDITRMKKDGMTREQISAELGVSTTVIDKFMATGKRERIVKPRSSPTKRRKRKSADDAQLNSVLVSIASGIDERVMKLVNELVRTMRETGCDKLRIDIPRGFVELPTPERFPLVGGDDE